MKVVIEIDRMPERCSECIFTHTLYMGNKPSYSCILQAQLNNHIWVNKDQKDRDCPLKLLEENENAE